MAEAFGTFGGALAGNLGTNFANKFLSKQEEKRL